MTDAQVKTSRRERKKDAARAQIIASAIELFSTHGFDAVTVDRIAEAADVGKGTVYNYFVAKEDIVVAFIVDLERQVQAELESFTSSKRRLDTILAEFVLHQFRMKEPHYRFIRVFLGQMFLRTEEFIPYLLQIDQAVDSPLEKLFSNLRDRGAIRTDVNVQDLKFTFKTVHLGLTAVWAIEGPPFRSIERIVRDELKVFCEGIQRKK
jgi:AcrR family transcriptional regulator